MANPEHLAILENGVDAWNVWMLFNPDIRPNLVGANLRGANLKGAYLREVDLREAELIEANLPFAILNYADLRGAILGDADLHNACLVEANLQGAYLRDADLSDAILEGADLLGSELSSASLLRANLRGANLKGAYLRYSNLREAGLQNADLREINLIGVDLSYAFVGGADLSEANLELTIMANLDLSGVKGMETVVHKDRSTVGTDTLALTLRGSGGRFTDEQIVFFEGAGVPPILLEYLPSMLEAEPIQFYSCFISYSTGDEEFASQINGDFNARNIRTWKWNLNAVAGRDLDANIDSAIRQYDKMILLCSVDSLLSGPVEEEIRRAIEKENRLKQAKAQRIKEARESGGTPPADIDTDVLVPINLDNYVFEWDSPLAVQITKKFMPDFTKAKDSGDAYKSALDSLIHALNPKSWPVGGRGLGFRGQGYSASK